MIKQALIAGGMASLAVTVLAQTANPPTFRTGTRLIEISIQATDHGDAVLDLTKDDFRVRDNKRDQEISFFIPPDALRSSTGDEETTPESAAASEPGSAAIVLDWLNTGFADKVYVRQKTLDMLSAIGLTDRVALFTNMRTLGVLHDFTSNNAALLEALSVLRANADDPAQSVLFGTRDMVSFAGIDGQIRADATRRNIRPVIEHLSRQPGRKSLIWVSSTFSGIPAADLIRANITLYLVDARGVQTKPLPPPGNILYGEGYQERIEAARRNNNRFMARSTGGVYFENRNDLDGAMREALAETHTSYTLGYYLPEDAEPGEHEIRIDVQRRGVKLRYRESYIEPPPAN